VLTCIALAPPAHAQWTPLVVDTLANTDRRESATRFALAVDGASTPHVVWTRDAVEFGGPRMIFYQMRTGGAWSSPVEIGDDGASHLQPALAVAGATGTPHVAYEGQLVGQTAPDLYYAVGTSSGFAITQITSDTLGDYDPAIAVDASGAAHITWVSGANDTWSIRYATNRSGAWAVQTVVGPPPGEFGLGASPSIAVTPLGVAHIAYRATLNHAVTYHIAHVVNDAPGGTTWTSEVLTSGNSSDTGNSLAIDATGGLHLVVSGNDCFGCTSRTYYFHKAPGAFGWDPYENLPPVGSTGLTSPSIAVDTNNTPHVATAQVNGNIYTGRILYSRRFDAGWVTGVLVGVDETMPSLAIGADGRGHLTCPTGANTGKQNVLYVGSGGLIAGVREGTSSDLHVQLRVSPNPFSREVRLEAPALRGAASATHCTVYATTGARVRELAVQGGGATWDGRDANGQDVPAGMYVLRADGRSVARVIKVR
jgi:hypothetical protein